VINNMGGEAERSKPRMIGNATVEQCRRRAGAPAPASCDAASVALALLGQKWTMLIVRHLKPGHLRHCQLQGRLGGLNSTTLSQRLRLLEEQGIVTRKVLSTIPPWVEYSLTDKGRELADIIESLERWSNKWQSLAGGNAIDDTAAGSAR